jgi:hypothetical protein
MTESEVFEAVTGSGTSDFALLARVLSVHGAWCLIGGLAVNCYVEPVYTLDADVVVAAAHAESIKEHLVAAGFNIQEFPHSINARMQGSEIRIQLSTDPRYQDFLHDTQLRGGFRRTSPGGVPGQSGAEKSLGLGRRKSPAHETEEGRARSNADS